MKSFPHWLRCLMACWLMSFAYAEEGELEVTDMFEGVTADDLVAQILGPGVSFSNATITVPSNSRAAGIFTGGSNSIGFSNGIVLSTGRADAAEGENTLPNVGTSLNLPGDPSLDRIADRRTLDAVVLEFDFIPTEDIVSFEFVFASEEYLEWIGSYNDVFAFFFGDTNRAVVGPENLPISIDTINPYRNKLLYRSNTGPDTPIPTQADGLTKVLTCFSVVEKNKVNHMKIAIADAVDTAYDSWVFIRTASFSSRPPLLMAKQVDRPVAFGGTTNSYTITLTNPGTVAANVTEIRDLLPETFTYVADSTRGITPSSITFSDRLVTWTGSFTIPPQGSLSFDFDVQLPTLPGTYHNSADATADVPVFATGETATVEIPAPDATELLSLDIEGASLNVPFNRNTIVYEIIAPPSVESIRIKPTTLHPDATLTIRDLPHLSGTPTEPIPLNFGTNTIPIEVTAVTGTPPNTRTYSLIVRRLSVGNPSPHFQTAPGGNILTIASQPDGYSLIGGDFSTIDGQLYPFIARIHPSGNVDRFFTPKPNQPVRVVHPLPNGDILIGGDFTQVGISSIAHLALLNPFGNPIETFAPSVNGAVHGILTHPDGSLTIRGMFSEVSGQPRPCLARILPDHTLDLDFTPEATDLPIHSIAPGPGQSLYLGGAFTQYGVHLANHILRILPDGQPDLTFNASANDEVRGILVQPDGKILVWGRFTEISGSSAPGMARLLPDGSIDPGFYALFDLSVSRAALQADGRIFACGPFTSVNGIPRSYIAKLEPDGTLCEAFDPDINSDVQRMAISSRGDLIISGNFTQINGAFFSGFAKLANDPAISSLPSPETTPDELRWTRNGTSPTAASVQFESSSNQGNSWNFLGSAARNENDWTYHSSELPSAARIRARASLSGSQPDDSSGTDELIISYPSPQIEVRSPDSLTTLQNNRVLDLGTFTLGSQNSLWLPIQNLGTASLNNLSLLKSGPHASDIAILSQPPVSLSPNQSTTVHLRFKALTPGTRVSTITVRSSDPRTPSFNVVLLAQVVADPNAKLDSLSLSIPGLQPGFDPDQTTYHIRVGSEVSEVQLNGLPQVSEATIRINGTLFTGSSVIPTPVGNTVIHLQVTAADSITTRDYFLTFQRDPLGTVDASFVPSINGPVLTSAILPDRKILIGGSFSSVNSSTSAGIARLLPDGSRDPSFLSPLTTGTVDTLHVDASARILIGGDFLDTLAVSSQPPVTRGRIARLLSDGSADPTFNPPVFHHGTIRSIESLADGRVLIAGRFSADPSPSPSPSSWIRILRLLEDGSADPSFSPPSFSPETAELRRTITTNQGILIAGNFTSIHSLPQSHLARLLPSGTPDPSFTHSANGEIFGLTTLPNGSTLAWGDATEISQIPVPRLFLLRPDASVTPFGRQTPVPDAAVHTLALQANGQILISGPFTHLDTIPRNGLARLDPLGQLDPALTTSTNLPVRSITLQQDGRILLGGDFTQTASTPTTYLSRVANQQAYERLQSLDPSSATGITWVRGGTAPEVSDIILEHSTDQGATWLPLGQPSRSIGAWDFPSPPSPPSAILRVRASTGTTSTGILSEQVALSTTGAIPSPPIIVAQGHLASFQLWASQAGLLGVNATPDATPFLDSLPNSLKYAFNLNGSGPGRQILTPGSGTSGLPSIRLVDTPEGPKLRFEYLRRNDPFLVYTPKISTQLTPSSFTSISGIESITPIDDTWQRVTIDAPVPIATHPQLFGLIDVSWY